MRMIKTLVVDDEPFARARILKLLEEFDFITVIGECKNGKEAVAQIQNYKPDLVFLDIQMPDFSGFEVLAKSEKQKLPFIIFVTAFNQYALKAFDVKAVDYLLKPYDNDRFAQALEHARDQIIQKDESLLHKKMVGLLEEHVQQQEDIKFKLEIKDKGKVSRINAFDIYYLEAQGNYIKVHLADKSFMIRETLQNIKSTLEKNTFLQIHRSVMINTNYINQVKYTGNNQYQLILKNGTSLHSSRSYKTDIQTYLNEVDSGE
ncbi:MAG: response regulator transcription factor [Saprospiraceae bacterium]|nr:response regulator transcription factor [Saprospiraceae bacterium]MCB9325552.1 response regulator transcription factor [Lewinellaceae bacterium]